ncbi:MAG: divalent metal cation transporter [Acidobacteriaceae bacterium]
MSERRTVLQNLKDLVPGVIAGAADLDPAAVLTATVAGASFQFALGWVVLLAIPVLYSVFGVSARIGSETRKGLIQLVTEQYGKVMGLWIALCIVLVNFAMIVGDIVAVGDSLSIITGLPRYFFLAAVGYLVWYVLNVGDFRRTTRVLALFSFALLAYVAAAYTVTNSVPVLTKGVFMPHLEMSVGYLMGVIAVFGSLLTPDVIVWQASTKRDLHESVTQAHKSESHAGTFVACLISLSAMICAAHLKNVNPDTLTITDAAKALAPLGLWGPFFFALGVIGSGLVALPILLASLSFSVAEVFGYEAGLSKRPWEARRFFILIAVVTVSAVIIDFFRVNTVRVLYWSQIIAGIVLMPLLFFIVRLSNDRSMMKTANTRFQNVWLWFALAMTVVANAIFFWVSVTH